MPFEFPRPPFVALIGFLLYAEDFETAVLLSAVPIFAGSADSRRRETRIIH